MMPYLRVYITAANAFFATYTTTYNTAQAAQNIKNLQPVNCIENSSANTIIYNAVTTKITHKLYTL